MMLVTSVTNDVAPKIRLFDNFYLYKFSLRYIHIDLVFLIFCIVGLTGTVLTSRINHY